MAAPHGNQYWKLALNSIFNGAPPKYRTAKQLEAKVKHYFQFVIDNDLKPQLCDMMLHLGFTDFDSIYYQEKRGKDFLSVIKKARLTIAGYYEGLLQRKGRGADIFALKQFGWTDQLTIDQHTIQVSEVIVTINDNGKQSRIQEGIVIPIDPPQKALGSK